MNAVEDDPVRGKSRGIDHEVPIRPERQEARPDNDPAQEEDGHRDRGAAQALIPLQPVTQLGAGNAQRGKQPENALDRVLCGEADESFVAADGCGEAKKGQVVAWMA
ncbi:hypothetical protein, partial [Streptomyces sp. NPDC058671]|uniref:hypothetical protein n=1 Tax=Streptomyces sp. NPDC058671 TaxID=3346590 RepID=UPI00364684C0